MRDEVVVSMALSIPVVIVPTVLLFKHVGRKRELLHIERMSAIERGLQPGFQGSYFWPSLAALGTGTLVPVFSILFAYLASLHQPHREEIWMVAMLVAVAGIIGGSTLLGRMFNRSNQRLPLRGTKPSAHEFDLDAYDTVGSRG